MNSPNRVQRIRDEHFKNLDTATTKGKIVSVSPETESITVDIGSATVQVAHPFSSGTAWIRAVPSVGTGCTVSYNTTTQRYEFVAYSSTKEYATSQLEAYAQRKSLYRSLKEGEIEVASSGGVTTHHGSRPTYSGRAGAVSWSYDSDKLESTATAPTHVLRGHNNKLDRIGNELRFGAVKRPVSYTRDMYALTAPFSMPQLDKYVYAYEYLLNLENDNAAPLIDTRVGEVYDNVLTPGVPFATPALARKSKLPLRARYRYFNTIEPGGLKAGGNSTDMEIDVLGNVDLLLSKLALQGLTIDVPSGNIKINASLASSLVSKLAVLIKSEYDKIRLESLKGIDIKSSDYMSMKATKKLSASGSDISLDATSSMKLGAVTISVNGSGMVTLHGAAGLSISGAAGSSKRPLPTNPLDIVTGVPLFTDPTLTS